MLQKQKWSYNHDKYRESFKKQKQEFLRMLILMESTKSVWSNCLVYVKKIDKNFICGKCYNKIASNYEAGNVTK